MEQHLNINTCITLHKKSLLFHFFVIFTSPVDLRPDGNHRLNAHLVQLVDHCLRIREVFLVKTVITASWPVIVVDHKNIQRNAAFFVRRAPRSEPAPGCSSEACTARSQGRTPASSELYQWHLQSALQFLPGYRLRLPSSRAALWCVPAIPLCSFRNEPHRPLHCATGSRSQGRYIKRNARLRITVRQFQVASLQVHSLLLILSHTINLLIRVGIEGYFQLISASL